MNKSLNRFNSFKNYFKKEYSPYQRDYDVDEILEMWLNKSDISTNDKWSVIKRLNGRYQSVACWIYKQLSKELDHYNINPYPSTDYLIVDINDKVTLGKINFAKRHCFGALEFNLYPMGTFYGHKPEKYDHMIFNVEYCYR